MGMGYAEIRLDFIFNGKSAGGVAFHGIRT